MSEIDIVERLHNAYAYDSRPIFKLAAAEIERLRAALRKLTDRLEEDFAGTKPLRRYELGDARAALEK